MKQLLNADYTNSVVQIIRRYPNLSCFLLIFLCFTMTSAGYLSWVYQLVELFPPETADLLSLGAGYSLQAAGIGLFAYYIKNNIKSSRLQKTASKWTTLLKPQWLCACVAVIYILVLVPAAFSPYPAASVIFGFLLNLLCGIIAGYYLHILAVFTSDNRRGLVFGGSYAASTIAVWLLSLFSSDRALSPGLVIVANLICLILTAVPAFLLAASREKKISEEACQTPAGTGAANAAAHPSSGTQQDVVVTRKFLILAAAVIFLLSLVKNIGFSFPSSDIASGINLELSRLFYGAGLLIAGIISDKNRKYGAICTLAALVIPFISLALAGETVPAIIFWVLDYFFYGFFSVFRVLYFSDLSLKNGWLYLAGAGLLLGRCGDVFGTVINIVFSGSTLALVLCASLLFFLTVFLFFRLYIHTWIPAEAKRLNEYEQFELFAASHDLSSREREVMRHLIQDESNAEIAAALFVSESTVKFHVHNLLKKTGCKNRLELIAHYYS